MIENLIHILVASQTPGVFFDSPGRMHKKIILESSFSFTCFLPACICSSIKKVAKHGLTFYLLFHQTATVFASSEQKALGMFRHDLNLTETE